MQREYQTRKKKVIAKKFIDYDNYPKTNPYQCIDLIKQYFKDLLWWWNVGMIWNANELRNNLYNTFWTDREQIVWTKDLMQWDIIFWLRGDYGHVGIIDSIDWKYVNILDQNGSGKNCWKTTEWNKIQIHRYLLSNFVGVRRSERIKEMFEEENRAARYIMEQLSKSSIEIEPILNLSTNKESITKIYQSLLDNAKNTELYIESIRKIS